MFAKLFLRIIGIKTEDGGRVSEEQLRLLVAGAQKSGGIEKQEGEMISQVLNMQDRKVSHTPHYLSEKRERRKKRERTTSENGAMARCLSSALLCVCRCIPLICESVVCLM